MLQAGKKKKMEGWEFIDSLANCSMLKVLGLGDNNFTGDLPVSVANLSTTLEHLYLDDLAISGSIPSEIGNLVGLKVLILVNTDISGVIPDSIGKLENLTKLHLDNNNLSGIVPSSVGNLTRLLKLSASSNNLGGSIPRSLGQLSDLISLNLSSNCLNGSIPEEIFQLQSLSLLLDLSHNSLSGPLPFDVGRLANLNTLSLSGNQLSGQIPTTIRNCIVLEVLLLDCNSFQGSIPQPLSDIKGLRVLNLTMNRFSGVIPDALGDIHNLQQLYLAHNSLSGLIPTDLQNLTSLSKLDLSFNDLQGEVPKEGSFRNLSYLSIAGNKNLCGGIPQLRLDPCPMSVVRKNNKSKRGLKYVKIALATMGALLFLALFTAVIQFIYKNCKQRQKRSNPLAPVISGEQYERVSYKELSDGTKGFSDANLLGKGSYGTVYKCAFIDEGTIAAVKVFNLEQSGSTRSFLAECEALRSVRHRCLIRIITCCSSIDRQGQEFKALVFEFMPNGNLSSWLHPKSNEPKNTLSLTQRLDIAVDIMDALDYLHNHCRPPIVHCDLKPSNILLAEDMSARVGDFGISRILSESACKAYPNSNSVAGIRGSVGYVAPGT
jgi:Leucine-rich repeat (LRR) protein